MTTRVAVPVDPGSRVPVGQLPIDPDVIPLLAEQGITALYPPQAEAVPHVVAGSNLLLACPTASGKSLVAYLALLRAARAGRTGLYLVPLRALAQEKYDELQAFGSLGVRVGISTGDFDLPNATLEKLDILVATSEKADSLLRKGSPWLDRLGVVVADEVHLMRDPDRGPTLEVSLTRIRSEHPGVQVVALSATVGNAHDVADWLDAELVESEFRPVPLRSGVYHDGRILFTDLSTREIAGPGDAVPRLVRTVLEEGGQSMVFVNTRRASEQLAQALTTTVRRTLSGPERAATEELNQSLLQLSEEETAGVRRLSELLPSGVAFHNASLTSPERRLVERAFRDRILKVLVATPTLAAGINLPARRVIVRDTTRYDDRLGMQAPIPAIEVHQMCGRAGRPRFDSAGEAVLIARSVDEEERFLDQYLSAPPEEVLSRLAAEPALRMHLLALVASGAVGSEAALEEFFSKTFYGHTLPLSELTDKVRSVRAFLETNEFLHPGPGLRATRFGALTSELYLDPMSALVLRRTIERAPLGVRPFALLASISATPDLPPLFLRRGEESEMFARYGDEEPELLAKPEEDPYAIPLDLFLATIKTAMVLEAWIDETPILELTERFGIGAGDLRGKVEDADWLLFGASRIAATFKRGVSRPIDDLSLRVRYGVREELLDLVRVRGIGRVRARALHRAGILDRDMLRATSIDAIEQALKSRRLAEAIARDVAHPRAPKAPTRPEPTTGSIAPAPARKGRRTSRRLEEYPETPGSPGP
ncbi:MAG TPA: DEAD/DEAH box helicase [Thermoplasmata archaeon]|nr:DEAD/DEAH box helicase [Thermoplasmata archaeon]